MTVATQHSEQDLARMLETFPLNDEEVRRALQIQSVLNVDGRCSLRNLLPSPSPVDILVEDILLPSSFIATFFGKASSSAFVVGAPVPPGQEETWTYLEAFVTCLGRRGPRPLNDLIFSHCGDEKDICNIDTDLLLDVIYRIVLATHAFRNGLFDLEVALQAPSSWSQTLKKNRFSRPEFMEWITTTFPCMWMSAATLFHCVFFSPDHPNFRPPAFTLPQVDQETLLWSNPWDQIPASLACLSTCLGGKWRRLYSSNEDAFSFRAFANSLIGYKGPTVLMIQSKSNEVLGYYSDSAWRYSNKWFGDQADAILFALKPEVRAFHPTGKGKHYQYLNLPPEHRTDQLKGLAIGGIGSDSPRLHITESFERCMGCAVDTTFENGLLLADELESYFDVDALEVFAVNVSDDEFSVFQQAGALQVAVHESSRRQAATVDKSKFLDDFVANVFLNKGFEHREHLSGRHEFKAD